MLPVVVTTWSSFCGVRLGSGTEYTRPPGKEKKQGPALLLTHRQVGGTAHEHDTVGAGKTGGQPVGTGAWLRMQAHTGKGAGGLCAHEMAGAKEGGGGGGGPEKD